MVLIHKKVQKVPETCILRQWRKDVRRQHTKVKISYFDWLQNPDNEQYDRMCKVFYEVVDLATHNEAKTRVVVDRIKSLCKELNEDEGAWGIRINIGRPPFKRKESKAVLEVHVFGNLNSEKDHGRNAPHASHPYNSIDAGFPLHLQDTGGTFPFRHGSHLNNYIGVDFPLHVQESEDNFPRAYPPNNFLGVNFPLQIPYPPLMA
ncbi:hypothetical protein IFM89_011235 [Coptis chinensis]|uniref:Protein FAR1-RELATED SEQUENCE n=1 Tax=Coptis chinensis TaxID=261450 RepID=A0A835LQ18_9MAGN|nr:hypothetical protein IFM89_011235 [Coptis chinensis]